VDQRAALSADLELLLQRLFGLAESEGLKCLADVDLTWSQVRVIMLLAYSQQQSISSVAEQLGVSIHSAGRTIDQLVELALVDRHENPADRRVKLVALTPRGVEIIDQHVAQKRRALRLFVDRLPDDRITALAEAIRPILTSDDPRTPSLTPEPRRV
jgi:DNA-binding MarR family transcriptional regulator